MRLRNGLSRLSLRPRVVTAVAVLTPAISAAVALTPSAATASAEAGAAATASPPPAVSPARSAASQFGRMSAVAAQPGPRRPLLLPNARPLPAAKLYVAHATSGARVLRFESGLANVGHGVLEVRPNSFGNCDRDEQHASQIIYRDRDGNGWFNRSVDKRFVRRDAGCMAFHPTHDHWHFEAAARYALWDPDRKKRPVVVQGRKRSFCLRDSRRVPDRWATRNYPLYYGACSQHSHQGISIGWTDIYGNYLPGQSLKLPGAMPNGLYCLRTTVDPKNQLEESDDTDNHSVRSVRIRGDHVTAKPTRRCRSVVRQ